MSKIFLSHSSKDKEIVRKFKNDLEREGYAVWFDEDEIGIGDEITKSIQSGLEETHLLIIWITKHAVESGWVRREWESKLHEEIFQNKTLVLPILAEDCEIPKFLALKRYADFRMSYEEGFSVLKNDLKKKASIIHDNEISNCVNGLIGDLSYAKIYFPNKAPIKIIKQLKCLPRTGKIVRLYNKFNEKIRIRTVYDHIISLSMISDIFINVINHNLKNNDIVDLAKCIVYHDLCEVILGDIPAYTNIPKSAGSNRAQAERLLRRWESKEIKLVANEFISLFLEEREIQNQLYVNSIMYKRQTPTSIFFNLLDKIDPIINVWRYINLFRDKKNFSIENFTYRWKDFFENQNVKNVARNFKADSRVYDLIRQLQDRNLAIKYFNDKSILDEVMIKSKLPNHTKAVVENIDIFYSNKIYSKILQNNVHDDHVG